MTQTLNEASWQEPIDLVFNPPAPALFLESSESEDDLTVVDRASQSFSKFYRFLHSHYYPEPFYLMVLRFLKEVQRRRIELRDFERVQYAHTIWQTLCRFGRRCVLHVKLNLST